MERTIFGALLLALLAVGCKKESTDTPTATVPPVNEQELITTVRLTFNTLSGAEVKVLEFSDPDGDGGAAPVITADTLSVDSIYDVDLEVLNESVSPMLDITSEIQQEGTVHQFFSQVTGADVAFAYGDADANGRPIGLLMSCIAGGASNGSLTLTLRHQPDKGATGVADGDITNAGGETDIEVTFPLVVE